MEPSRVGAKEHRTYTVYRVYWGRKIHRQYRTFHALQRAEEYLDELEQQGIKGAVLLIKDIKEG